MKKTFFFKNKESHMYLSLHHLQTLVPKQINSASYVLHLAL